MIKIKPTKVKVRSGSMYAALGRDSVHPFPARMAPSIALKIVGETKKSVRILDPMMGSGTVIALARAHGHQAVGIDIDPLAVLISKVWTTAIDKKKAETKAISVLTSAQNLYQTLFSQNAYPVYADEETQQFLDYWFDEKTRKQLTALSSVISRIREESIRNVLWCAVSRLIIAKKSGVSLAMDLSHSRPHKVFKKAPVDAFEKFLPAVKRVVENCLEKNDKGSGPAPTVSKGDARQLPIEDGSIDIVLTSPPYLNAIDYMRCSKFSLVWMGYSIKDLRQLRSESVGSELGSPTATADKKVQSVIRLLKLKPGLTPRNEAVLSRYIYDMSLSVSEVARVLSTKGKAVYVVGENTIRGTYIRNSSMMKAVAKEAGLKFYKQQTRILPANRRYLPPPSRKGGVEAMDVRMRKEVIMTFVKQI